MKITDEMIERFIETRGSSRAQREAFKVRSSRGREINREITKYLRDQGFIVNIDGSTRLVYKNGVLITSLEQYKSILESSENPLFGMYNQEDNIYATELSALSSISCASLRITKISNDAPTGADHIFVGLSDLHLTDDYGELFNPTLAVGLVMDYVNKVARELNAISRISRIDTVYVLALGDIIGGIKAFRRHHYTVPIALQQKLGATVLTIVCIMLRRALPEGIKMEFIGVPGNHSYVSNDLPEIENFDSMIYDCVNRSLEPYPTIKTYTIGQMSLDNRTPMIVKEIQGKIHVFIHGNKTLSPGGKSGPWNSAMELMKGWGKSTPIKPIDCDGPFDPARGVQYIHVGHFHNIGVIPHGDAKTLFYPSIQKRTTLVTTRSYAVSEPSQMMTIFDEKGSLKSVHFFELEPAEITDPTLRRCLGE